MCSYGRTSVCNPPDYILKCLKYNYLNETTTIKRKAFNKKENLFEPSTMELTSDFYVTSVSTGS